MAMILLVEDDEQVRTFVARALEMDGHSVVEACDGEEGLEHFDAEADGFDLVLSDIQMPAMDGIEMAKTIAERRSDQKILMMTGYANQRERAESLSRVVIDVVQKPFTLPQIREHVANALNDTSAAA